MTSQNFSEEIGILIYPRKPRTVFEKLICSSEYAWVAIDFAIHRVKSLPKIAVTISVDRFLKPNAVF
jgi:hypothetical protein